MPNSSVKTIGFVLDDHLSRERLRSLAKLIQFLGSTFKIRVFRKSETQDGQLLKILEKEPFDLVLAPFREYLAGNKIDGFFGTNRLSGPTFAGYLAEPIPFETLPESNLSMRRIILDLVNLNQTEVLLILQTLVKDTLRTGITPLLAPTTLIYCENWYSSSGQGNRIDHLLAIPPIAETIWNERISALRILLSAFWGLVYEEGPGKAEAFATASSAPKAYFQIGIDANALVMRLCYGTSSHVSPGDLIKQFTPDPTVPTRAGQILLRYADFVRVHTFTDTHGVEVVAALFPSAASEKAFDQLHTLWIEPLTGSLLKEQPFTTPSPDLPQLRALPSFSRLELRSNGDTLQKNQDKAREKMMDGITAQVKELRKRVEAKEEEVHELRTGGIGTSSTLTPPDVETLLETFQERYFQARFQIRQFQNEIAAMEKRGATPQAIETLRLKMEALANRERSWIKKLIMTLEACRREMKKTP